MATPLTRTTTDLSPLARRVIEAYGGDDRWRLATAVEATVTARGFAFLAKTRIGVHNLSVRAEIARPYVTMKPFGKRDVEVLDGHSVRIENDTGEVIASRDDAGASSRAAGGRSAGTGWTQRTSPATRSGTT